MFSGGDGNVRDLHGYEARLRGLERLEEFQDAVSGLCEGLSTF